GPLDTRSRDAPRFLRHLARERKVLSGTAPAIVAPGAAGSSVLLGGGYAEAQSKHSHDTEAIRLAENLPSC
ncbi:MAG: hypothetical protein ACJ78W_11440, partial [Myxococcales bacterium]